MRKIVKISKFLHKWIGLLFIIYIIYMSITGIILSHPEFFSEIDVPQSLTPHQYDFYNWNRSALISIVKSDSSEYIYGYNGIYEISSGSKQAKSIMHAPFPSSAWNMKTRTAIAAEIGGKKKLIAGTFDGIYSYDIQTKRWEKHKIDGESKKMTKILDVRDSIFAFSESEMYVSAKDALNFKAVRLEKAEDDNTFSLMDYFFDLHNGRFLGQFGVILYDIVGIIAIFLSVSAFYMWYYPKRRKKASKKKLTHSIKELKIFKMFNKYHLKFGIWTFVILAIWSLTGIFMRPPLIMFILSEKVSNTYHVGISRDSDFSEKLRNVLYYPNADIFVFDTKDGVYAQQEPHSNKLSETYLPIPIFAMGATVFDTDIDGNLLIGSFAGLFEINGETGRISDVTSGNSTSGIGRPSENLVTGYFVDDDGVKYITSHYAGLIALNGYANPKYEMPKEIADNLKLSLWNYAFELHNGRFFADWIGEIYILIVPLSGILFLLLIFSGVLDWIWRKRRKISAKFK